MGTLDSSTPVFGKGGVLGVENRLWMGLLGWVYQTGGAWLGEIVVGAFRHKGVGIPDPLEKTGHWGGVLRKMKPAII